MIPWALIPALIITFLAGALTEKINQPSCFERQPAAWLRQDCSIKISKTLKEYSQECKQGKKGE